MKQFATTILAMMFWLPGLGAILGAPELDISTPWQALVAIGGLLCMSAGVGIYLLAKPPWG